MRLTGSDLADRKYILYSERYWELVVAFALIFGLLSSAEFGHSSLVGVDVGRKYPCEYHDLCSL